MNNLQIFNSTEFGAVRTLEENDKVLFCGSDVAKSLGYNNAPDALARHCRAIVKRDTPVSGKMQPINFISEGDVYRLITHSKLPSAERFERWVFDEVLPSMRRTGGYVSDDDMFIRTYMPFADEHTKDMFRAVLSNTRELNAKIEADKPKVIFAEAVTASKTSILIGELAKLLRQNGREIGQNRLFDWMRSNGYLVRAQRGDYNMPTQRAMEMGLFEIKETSITHSDGHITVSKTVKVTGKGQVYFINKLKEAC